MRVGAVVHSDGLPLHEAVARARLVEEMGLDSAWLVQLPGGRESRVVLTAYAAATERVTLGTAVLPIYTQHPAVMAQAAATLDELSGGRLILGLGVGHQFTMEWMLGIPMGSPLQAMREYVTIVRDLLRTGRAELEGSRFTARVTYAPPRRAGLPIFIGALSPSMLRLAGAVADGVVLMLCSPAYIRDHVVPNLHAGLECAGRDATRFPIVSVVCMCHSADVEGEREGLRTMIAGYARLPFYRQMFEVSGFGDCLRAGTVSDEMVSALCGVGGAEDLGRVVDAYRAAGCTLLAVAPSGAAHAERRCFVRTLEAALARAAVAP